jgi:DMSO/TMAO reductase YedYZ molybdopterin-dependent catalytic subunit
MSNPHATTRPSNLQAAVAGLAAGGIGIGLAELFAGLVAGAPSLIIAIGSLIIELQPPGAKQFVVDLFGDADKLVLNLAVVVVALGMGTALGIIATRRWWAGAAGFGAIGALALYASLRDPLVDAVLAVVTVAIAVGSTLWVLRWLLGIAARRAPASPRMLDFDRRRFLGTTVAVAGGAIAAGTIGRVLLQRRADAVAAVPPVPQPGNTAAPVPSGAALDVPGISKLVTPNESFYRIDTALLTPRLDASTWQLEVNGMVDRPYTMTYQELLDMPLIEQYVTIACVSNEVGGGLVGNAKWRGARLRDVLDRAGVREGATQIVGRAYDGFTVGFPTSWLDNPDREAMVVVAMNDEPLPPEHGYPARLIVPGLYGYVSATKWLTNIELTTLEAFDAYWVPRGWAKEAPILTQARIDVPRSPGARLAAGSVPVAGVAWAPDRGISRVEVQVDGGAWQEARTSTPISDATWVQWVYDWPATSGNHTLSVRATDGNGEVQTDRVTGAAPDGARGHHTISVSVA